MPRRVPRNRETSRRTPVPTSNRTGRPTRLNDRLEDAITHGLLEGHSITTVCGDVGISRHTFAAWMRRGEAAQQHTDALEDDAELDPAEVPFLNFLTRVQQARAGAEKRAIKAVTQQMAGGSLIHEKPLQNIQGELLFHPETGEPMMERTYSQPDGRLGLAYLGKIAPRDWGRDVQHIELTGAGGGPVAVSTTEAEVVSLADRISGVIAARQADDDDFDTVEGETEVVDAEIVEDGDPRRDSA